MFKRPDPRSSRVSYVGKSPLRHRIKVQIKGHFDGVPEWPTFLPRSIIARLSRVAFLEALEDDVQTGGDGSVPVSGGVLVAATGGGVGMPEAGHQLALGGAGPSGEGASRVAKVVEVQFVVSYLVASPAPRRSTVRSASSRRPDRGWHPLWRRNPAEPVFGLGSVVWRVCGDRSGVLECGRSARLQTWSAERTSPAQSLSPATAPA
jgi:hypothetical protein